MNTARISKAISGKKLYQLRARSALPLLVRQAKAGTPIFYSDLAEELKMSNPRNLNYVLGSIGQTLERLSKHWNKKVPPIQCLVINKNTGLPGIGIGWFLEKRKDFRSLSKKQKRVIVEAALQSIFSYRFWPDVLKELSLKPAKSTFQPLIETAAKNWRGGESDDHKELKAFVAKHPEIIGLPKRCPKGVTEEPLPSGDLLDVSFKFGRQWIAAEVKSKVSKDSDIVRGLFQCVKYRAVIEAVQLANSKPQNAEAILVLERDFPASLLSLKNLLNVEVYDKISPYKS